MRIGNQAFKNSLRCLQHPLSLLSIALLLLNDHVFKVFSPSWLTGKLSDFAGIFFFPFVVAAGVSLLLYRRNCKPRTIGQISFALVALWFLLLKTSPFVNSLTSHLSSSVLGFRTQFILDPADIVGLLALIPAWGIWDQQREIGRSKLGYAALSIGMLAVLATSPPMPTVEVVTHLWMDDETVIAYDLGWSTVATSTDGGQTWEPDYEFDRPVPTDRVPLPIVVCMPDHQDECYRVNGEGIVEISEDAGKSWEISWELPPDRVTYIKHANPEMDLGPYDLMILQWENRTYVLVAAGEEGVLRKELPDGGWERIGVENATPTPYQTTSLSEAVSITVREILAWFVLSILAFHIACGLVWSVNANASPGLRGVIQWIVLPALSPLMGILLAALFLSITGFLAALLGQLIAGFAYRIGLGNTVNVVAMATFVLLLLGALAIIPLTIFSLLKKWRLILAKNHYSAQTASALAWLAYLTHVCTFFIGCIFWILWAMGVITRYDVTILFTLAATSVVALIFFRKIRGLSKQNGLESTTSEP